MAILERLSAQPADRRVWTPFSLVPHLFALWGTYVQAKGGSKLPWPWQDTFVMSSLWAFILSQLTVAFASGSVIACERADRSAEFLASLPIARRKILASKLLFVFAIIAAIWVTTGLTVWSLRLEPTAKSVYGQSDLALLLSFTAVAVSGAAIFGPAWLLSSFASSPTIAVCGGLATPLVVWLGIMFAHNLYHPNWNDVSESSLGLWYGGICLVLGIAGFVAGTWYYLRRVRAVSRESRALSIPHSRAKGDAMKWLFWKDYRHNRPIVIFGLILLLVPHLFALGGTYWWATHGYKGVWSHNFAGSSLWSLIMSQLTIAVAAGNAIAGERADRSAEFLASLPIPRRKILVSKLLLVLAITAVIWVTDGLMVWGLVRTDPSVIYVFGRSVGDMLSRLLAWPSPGRQFSVPPGFSRRLRRVLRSRFLEG